MIPVAPIVLAVIAVSSYASRRKAGGGAPRPAERFRWHWLVWVFAVPAALFLIPLTVAREVSLPAGAAISLGLFVVIFPWLIARHVLVPLGAWRAAYYVTALSDVVWTRDHLGGAALAAAWALCRSRTPGAASARAAAWIESRIVPHRRLSAADIVATGLCAAARGDLEQARALLGSVNQIEPLPTPPMAYRVASEWLAADAAARGDWKGVERIARGLETVLIPDEMATSEVAGSRARSGVTRFLGAAAARIRGEGWPPTNPGLWLAWALSWRPIALWPLLSRALATPPEMLHPSGPEPLVPTAPSEDRLGDALALHAAVLRRPPSRLTESDLKHFGEAWDRALADPATRRLATERSLALGTARGEGAIDQIALAVQEDLASLARAADLPLEKLSEGETGAGAAQRVRDALLTEIELTCDALRQRVDDKRELPAIDEWREWTRLRLLCERAAHIGGVEMRRLAFPKVHTDACALAVWLWNIRAEKLISNTIFRWLLVEATAVDDARAIELQRKNCGCGV